MTSRVLDPTVVTAILDRVTRTVILVRLDFGVGNVVLAHNRLGEIVYNSETYLGVGNMGTINQLSEGSDIKPFTTKVSIQGFPPSLVSTALSVNYQGRPASVFVAALDEDNNIISTEPFFKVNYRIDYMEGSIDGDKASLTVVLQSRLSDWARSNTGRYTDAYHKRLNPTDKGFEFIAEMVDKEINWGLATGSKSIFDLKNPDL